jgi:hypothetical protein
MLAVTAALIAAGAGTAGPSGGICSTLGLTASAVKHDDHIIRAVSDEGGRPQCIVLTRKGTVYIAFFPPSAAKALQKSWAFDLHVTTETPPGLGTGAVDISTDGHRQEALGFVRGHRYVWIDTASRFAHEELLALAATIYAKL